MRGVEVSDETLGLDILEEMGPGGKFIDHPHTAEHFRQELWFPRLLDRDYYQAWFDGGARSMEERCREAKDRILASHTVVPLESGLDRALQGIVTAARRELSGG